MSYFDDLLAQPLPSTNSKSYMESEDDIDFDKEFGSISDFDEESSIYGEGRCGEGCSQEGCSKEGCSEEGCSKEACGEEGCNQEGCSKEDDNSDLDDLIGTSEYDDPEDDEEDDDDEDDSDDDLFDDEPNSDSDEDIDSDLEELEKEIRVDGSLDGDPDTHIPSSVDDPTPAKPVSKEADIEGDRMMAICATPTVLEDALTLEEAEEFLRSGDSDIAVAEGLLLESDLDSMIAELSSSEEGVFTESKFASPNQKYKMTKKAKLHQLYELSLQIEARLHHDPYYPKIQKAYKIERTIKAGWRKRYGQLAAKRAKKYLRALMNSKSSTLRKAGKRMSGK